MKIKQNLKADPNLCYANLINVFTTQGNQIVERILLKSTPARNQLKKSQLKSSTKSQDKFLRITQTNNYIITLFHPQNNKLNYQKK